MAIYTVISEGYEVIVYRSQKAVAEGEAAEGRFIVPDDPFADDATWAPATRSEILRSLRKYNEVSLSEEDGSRDWVLKINKH